MLYSYVMTTARFLLITSTLLFTYSCDPLSGYDEHECYCGVVSNMAEIILPNTNTSNNQFIITAQNNCSGNEQNLEVIRALYKQTEVGDTACFGVYW